MGRFEALQVPVVEREGQWKNGSYCGRYFTSSETCGVGCRCVWWWSAHTQDYTWFRSNDKTIWGRLVQLHASGLFKGGVVFRVFIFDQFCAAKVLSPADKVEISK